MAEASFIIVLLEAIITLFVIVDPFASAAFFVGFAKNSSQKERNKAILTAISVAAILLFIFLFSGPFLLKMLGISFSGFRIAGGIILLLLGITTVLGIDIGGHKRENINSAAILIGTPLLSGPGALTTVIVLSQKYGYAVPAIAALVTLILSFIILKLSFYLYKLLGGEVIAIMSKVLGLLLSALAVDYIYTGAMGFISGAV